MISNNFFVLTLFCAVLISFSLIFTNKAIKSANVYQDYNKEFEAFSFDSPVGKPDGKGYYNAQKFGENNHLGDDLNGIGGGNTDYGDSIFSIANGQVTFAKDIKGGWGKVIRIKHLFEGKYYESLYAHCSNLFVNEGDWIKKGYHIGNIGDCDGKYSAHLHLEIRNTIDMPIGGGYSSDNKGYVDAAEFILKN